MAVETIQRVCAKIGERSPLSADLKTGAASIKRTEKRGLLVSCF